MDTNEEEPSDEDPRLPRLRVRIKRLKNWREANEIMEEIIAMGFRAVPLASTIAEHMGYFVDGTQIFNLVVNLKSSNLLGALLESGFQLSTLQKSKLLEAGFPEYEKVLLDELWDIKDETSYTETFAALRALGRNASEEGLVTLEALLDHLGKRLQKQTRAPLNDLALRLELGQIGPDEFVTSGMGFRFVFDFHENVSKAIERLRVRHKKA
jgi:hypothetical protein